MSVTISTNVRTVFVTLLAATAAAVIVFPRAEETTRSMRPPIARKAARAGERIRFHNELIQREMSADAARSALANVTPSAMPRLIVKSLNVSALVEDRVRQELEYGLVRLARRDSSMTLVVVIKRDATGTGGTAASWRRITNDAFTAIGSPNTCTIVLTVADSMVFTGRRTWDPIVFDTRSLCMRYAAYGTPGRGMRAWLDSTSFGPLLRGWSGYEQGWYRGGILGLTRFLDAPSAACSAGRPHACSSVFFAHFRSASNEWWWDDNVRFSGWAPRGTANADGWAESNRAFVPPANWFASSMLTHMEHELGADNFAMIWKSDEPFDVAFASVRGQSLDTWLRGQVNRGTTPYHTGPLPDAPLSFALLLFIPALIALGIAGVASRGDFT